MRSIATYLLWRPLTTALVLFTIVAAAKAYEPTSHYTVKNIEGWKVYVNNALLPGGEHAETGTAALKQLHHDMVRVKQWVPDEPLKILLKVAVWLEVDTTNGPHGKTPVFHYHPGLAWLVKMDFHPGKHKCVEFSRASTMLNRRRGKTTAKTLLHEFAHSYHDQILTFDDPDILSAHKRAREGTAYPSNDWVVRANHKEFFAGVSTRYFGTKEEREALFERDPILLKKLQQVWGTPKAFMDTPLPTPDEVKQTPYEPSSHFTVKNIEGWTVTVNTALLPGGEHAETGAAALKQLQEDMIKVKQIVPDEPLDKLLKVGIWLEVNSTNGPHGKTPTFHYHPELAWLVKMDFHPGKHHCVEFSRASSLVQAGQRKRSVNILLHELAHAYHDQILTFDDPDILTAYKKATEGKARKSNHKEFFAGASTRYFSAKQKQQVLNERDPVFFKKLQHLWGTPKAFMDTLPPKADGSKKTPK